MTRRTAGRRRHRAGPRYGRIAVLVVSLALTVSAGVGAVGLVPYPGQRDSAQAGELSPVDVLDVPAATDANGAAQPDDSPDPAAEPSTVDPRTVDPRTVDPITADPTTAPPSSGEGRRIVYDMSDQRVWLVTAEGRVLDSYLVSGSVLDNLDAGRYEVYSKSRDAIGYTEDSTMRNMVRFTQGENAAIGFHDIPLDDQGNRLQSVAQLGSPTSQGCIRQRPRDARRLWDFAPVGTPVVVLD